MGLLKGIMPVTSAGDLGCLALLADCSSRGRVQEPALTRRIDWRRLTEEIRVRGDVCPSGVSLSTDTMLQETQGEQPLGHKLQSHHGWMRGQ